MPVSSLLHTHRTLVRISLFAAAAFVAAACGEGTPAAPTSPATSSLDAMYAKAPDTVTKKYVLSCGDTLVLTYVLGPNGGTYTTTVAGQADSIQGELGYTYVNDGNPINISAPIQGGTYNPTTGTTTVTDSVNTSPYPTTNIWINWIDVYKNGKKCSWDKNTGPAPITVQAMTHSAPIKRG